MKVSRIVLMLALVSFALMSFATNDVDRTSPKTKISIEKAAQNPGLTAAILQQVDESILGGDRLNVITAIVKYKKFTFVVYGTYAQWRQFFTTDKMVYRKPHIDL